MNHNKVKILVACHKPDSVYEDDVYTPIHVGRAISPYKEEMANMIGDDTGDNISVENPRYCELTAIYWGWKNLKDIDYFGLCHYRRYFQKKITNENIQELMSSCDFIVAKKVAFAQSIKTWLSGSLVSEDVYILYKVILAKCPDKKCQIDDFFMSNAIYPCNMFICKKEIFDSYAEWLFDILFTVDKFIKPSSYSRLKREMGYLSEVLLTLYIQLHGYVCKEMPLISNINTTQVLFSIPIHRQLKTKLAYWINKVSTIEWDYALITGMKNDGIYDELETLTIKNGDICR